MIEEHFRTPVYSKKSDRPFHYNNKLLFIGSCFSTVIGQRLLNRKFDVSINPNGIIYNPISIVDTISRVFSGEKYLESDLYQYNDSWLSFRHHGSFSNRDKTICLKHINESHQKAVSGLEKLHTVFVTLGSAWVYERVENQMIVANCHKIPQKEFSKRLLSKDEIVDSITKLVELAKTKLPNLNFVFTVSPIRHIKDGMVEDRLSKSMLLVAVQEIVKTNENSSYFEAYEMMIDDLRDYRFYEKDMIHPNELATDYIWEQFKNTYVSESEYALMSELEKLHTAVSHRPFNVAAKAHQTFLQMQLKKIQQLEAKHVFLNLKDLKSTFEEQLLK